MRGTLQSGGVTHVRLCEFKKSLCLGSGKIQTGPTKPSMEVSEISKAALPPGFHLRLVVAEDIPALNNLIALSVRELHTPFYTAVQIESAIKNLYVVNPVLVDDGAYFAVVFEGLVNTTLPEVIVGVGGWTCRSLPSNEPLTPATEAAKLKALYINPTYGRMGIAKVLLNACEQAAREMGFTRMEFIATLAGVKFYLKHGYMILDNADSKSGRLLKDIGDGQSLHFVSMGKDLS